MIRYEYRVVPAPAAGLKAKGLKTSEARFANALETVMNELGAEGWSYVRADTLPCEERSGLTGRVTKYQNMLVFQRALPAAETSEVVGLLAAPTPAPAPAPASEPAPATRSARSSPFEAGARAPAPKAEAHGPAEPRFSRSDYADHADPSAAARAAAAALRPFRAGRAEDGKSGEPPRVTGKPGSGSGVAAE